MELCRFSRVEASVHKFGGSSLKEPSSFVRVANIIIENTKNSKDSFVVVSAAGKSTNKLIEIANKSKSEPLVAITILDELYSYQNNLIDAVHDKTQQEKLRTSLHNDVFNIKSMIEGSSSSQFELACWVCFGEVWSARLLAAVLIDFEMPALFVDARNFLSVANNEVDFELSINKLNNLKLRNDMIKVVTGYIAADENGKTTTLGRNGSDYSASVCARLTSASKLVFWSDVSGVYSADPNVITNAFPHPVISWETANQLAHSGSSVLHQRTLEAVYGMGCEIQLKNSMSPNCLGTKIVERTGMYTPLVSRINNLCLLRFQPRVEIDSTYVINEFYISGEKYYLLRPECISIYDECKSVSVLFVHGISSGIDELLFEHGVSPFYIWEGGLESFFVISDLPINDEQYNSLHELICFGWECEEMLHAP
jgi:aspartokinase/homoserine dehydrogenase 2